MMSSFELVKRMMMLKPVIELRMRMVVGLLTDGPVNDFGG